MVLRHALSCALLLAAAALVNVSLSGCGEASGNSGSQAYNEVLHGLSDAARSGANYDAVRRARDLEPANEAMIKGFCLALREFVLSKEDPRDFGYPYVYTRIEQRGQMERREMTVNVDPRLVKEAMEELHETINPKTLNVELDQNYVNACYH